MGNAVGAGLGQNPARQSLIHAGLPSWVPGFTVNKVCGSGLKSIILGAQAIACEAADVILAGGAENVSQCPYILPGGKKIDIPKEENAKDSLINDGLWCSLSDAHMGTIAEYTAERFKISREAQDDCALQSYSKACEAQGKGLFKEEIVPIQINNDLIFDVDERVKAMSMDELSRMRPAFKPGGSITSGNSPAPADGAAVVGPDLELRGLGGLIHQRLLGHLRLLDSQDLKGMPSVPSNKRASSSLAALVTMVTFSPLILSILS